MTATLTFAQASLRRLFRPLEDQLGDLRRLAGLSPNGGQRYGLVPILDHIKEETPPVEILADVVKRNLQQCGVAEVAGLFDTCRNRNLKRLNRERAGR
jgi:hypothetical protein